MGHLLTYYYYYYYYSKNQLLLMCADMIEAANNVNVDAVIQTAKSADSDNLQETTAQLQSTTEPHKLHTKTFYSQRETRKPSRYLLNA
jgi:hypothetical protein